ncbi:MAG: ABC transporter ATP-binding protein [Actinomycetaceae bacterium]|nr:ABC transporter ATP-binding protein [Actinomycetaceae bacterium]
MAFIEVKNVSYSYPNGVKAVEDVSFSIESGESVAIIGQNGAGKTTTVKLLNGLLKPTEGNVIVAGKNTRDLTAAQTARHVGYVFQNPDDQIFNSTVFNEVEYALKRMKVDVDEARRRVEDAAALCGLSDELETNPYDLPLSIRKFVTIASVMALDPEVIILDEPTAGQDLTGLRRISSIIEHLESLGKVIITITHDMEFVSENFTRIIVMANRRIVTEGPATDIFQNMDAMEEARLNQPVFPKLIAQLKTDTRIRSVSELASYLKKGEEIVG